MDDENREIVVTDVKMPFWSMVALLVKSAIAGIPALIILLAMGALVAMVMALLFGGGMHLWEWNRKWM